MPYSSRPAATLILFGLSLLLLGCTSITVTNQTTEGTVVVWVREPDFSRGGNLRIPAGGSASTLSAYGGRYSITITDHLIQEARLLQMRKIVSRGITINQRNAELVAQLREALKTYNQLLANLEEQGITCGGTVPDWGSVYAVVTWDPETQDYRLSCRVETE